MKKKQPLGVGMTQCNTELGSYIRERRIELDLKQVQLAKQCDCTQNEISNIETGEKKYLNYNQLTKLATALKCDAEELHKRMLVKPGSYTKTELGKFIRSRREELGMTVESFAKKMRMTPQQARNLEIRKNSFIGYKLLNQLTKILNLNPSDLSKFIRTMRKETTSELGRLVRSRRKELMLSIGALAKRMGVSRQFVNQIEFGKARLCNSNEVVARLAKVLDLDVDKLEAIRPKRRLKHLDNTDGLGRFLATKRLDLHLTQREVAERLEVGASVVSNIEREYLRPSVDLLKKFSQILGCEIPPDQNLMDFDRIKELSDIRSNTEVVRKALKTLRLLLEKQKDGHAICLRKGDTIVELEFLF